MRPDQLSPSQRPPAEGAAPAGDAARGPADATPDPDLEPHPPAPRTELEDQLRRALADLDNLRKRYTRELAAERERERARVTSEWLPVVDNLERALQHAGSDDQAVLDGVRAVYEQAVSVLTRLGFPRFEDVGEPFDPNRHEAVVLVGHDETPGTVVATVRPGYGTPDAMLRPAGVVVSRRPE